MRKDFGIQTWLYPMPVLIIGTWNEDGTANAMNAAWGGIYDTNKISVCIDPGHKTAANLLRHEAFTVCIGEASLVTACDYLGIVSGNDTPDKLARAGVHAENSPFVHAPRLSEFGMILECRLISFDEKTGCTVGDIVNISADQRVLDEEGKISPEKLAPICFDPVHHTYLKLGEAAGKAFSDGKKLQ